MDHLNQASVKIFSNAGSAQFVDGHTLGLTEGTSLQGENIIICAGGHARRFSFPGYVFLEVVRNLLRDKDNFPFLAALGFSP